jgi:hypothetical protein
VVAQAAATAEAPQKVAVSAAERVQLGSSDLLVSREYNRMHIVPKAARAQR